jgi:hypothetical protein
LVVVALVEQAHPPEKVEMGATLYFLPLHQTVVVVAAGIILLAEMAVRGEAEGPLEIVGQTGRVVLVTHHPQTPPKVTMVERDLDNQVPLRVAAVEVLRQ